MYCTIHDVDIYTKQQKIHIWVKGKGRKGKNNR